VAGFDDVVMSGMARINLTTVRQPQPQLANLAVELLASRINGDQPPQPVRRTLQVELIVRGSTGPPPRPAGQPG
jgi:LacI family transcriptional regulator